MSVADEFDDSKGSVNVSLWGRLRVMRSSGAEMAKAQAQRYLSELFWTPYSILGNRHLTWREVDDRAVAVGTTVDTSSVAVTLEFDEPGDIVAVSTPACPRQVGRTTVDTPWRGKVGAYDAFAGMRLPGRAEVAWELPEGLFTYWEGEITGAQLL